MKTIANNLQHQQRDTSVAIAERDSVGGRHPRLLDYGIEHKVSRIPVVPVGDIFAPDLCAPVALVYARGHIEQSKGLDLQPRGAFSDGLLVAERSARPALIRGICADERRHRTDEVPVIAGAVLNGPFRCEGEGFALDVDPVSRAE